MICHQISIDWYYLVDHWYRVLLSSAIIDEFVHFTMSRWHFFSVSLSATNLSFCKFSLFIIICCARFGVACNETSFAVWMGMSGNSSNCCKNEEKTTKNWRHFPVVCEIHTLLLLFLSKSTEGSIPLKLLNVQRTKYTFHIWQTKQQTIPKWTSWTINIQRVISIHFSVPRRSSLHTFTIAVRRATTISNYYYFKQCMKHM